MDLTGFEHYLREQGLAMHTVRGYVRDVAAFVRWFEQTNGEPFALPSVTPTDLREWRGYLQHRLKAATVNRKMAALVRYLRWARAQGQIAEDPSVGLTWTLPRLERRPRWLDKRERYALLRTLEQDVQTARLRYPKRWVQHVRNALLTRFLLHTGLRVSEALALRWGDVALRERSGWVLVREGKGRLQAEVPLNAEARKALREWLEVQGQGTPEAGGRVWPITARTYQRYLERTRRRAGLERLTPHTLRHTFGRMLVEQGVPLQTVSRLMRHRNVQTTMLYIMPGERDLERAVEALAG